MRRNSKLNETDQFKGLYISEKEIDDILEEPGSLALRDCPGQKEDLTEPEEAYFKRLEKDINNRKKEALNRGLKLRLDILQNLFSLSRIEVDTLLICLLAEIDLRYQKLYAYLQDDITKKAPTINLVLRFLCDSPEKTFLTREYFHPESPLIKYHLISLQDDRVSGSTSLLTKFIHLDECITGYLLDQDGIDSRLTSSASLVIPQKKLPDLVISEDMKNRLFALISNNKDISLICGISSAHGSNKLDIAEAICSELNKPMLVVSVKALLPSETAVDNLIPLIFREGSLQNAVIYLDSFDSLTGEAKETTSIYNDLIRELRSYPNWVMLGIEKEWQPEGVGIGKPCINVKLSSATYAERLQIWEKLVKGDRDFAPDINITDLAGKFKFNSGQIFQVANVAKNLAKWRDPETGLVTNEDLYAACRKQSGETLNTLARKIHPSYAWEDIILPKDQMEQLREICSYVEHYHTVYDAWGFGRKVSLGKGLESTFLPVLPAPARPWPPKSSPMS